MELGRWVIRSGRNMSCWVSLHHPGHKLRLQKGAVQSPFKILPTTGDPLPTPSQTHEHCWKTLHIWTVTGEMVMDFSLSPCYDQFLNGGNFLSWECYGIGILLHKASVSEVKGVSLCLLLACDEEQSHTCGCSSNGSGQGFRTVLVWMLCHKRRICGNWHPRTPWGCGNWYSPCGKQLGTGIESHPNTHIPWLTSLLGVYPKKIILKKEKVTHEGVMGALFSEDENQEMYKPQVGKIFRQRAKWYTL